MDAGKTNVFGNEGSDEVCEEVVEALDEVVCCCTSTN
jgi:hypothetical protein